MKKFLSGVGLLAFNFLADAHDSWAPHTHTIDRGHSDFFYLSVGGIFALFLAALARTVFNRRRQSKPVRARRPLR